MNNQEYNYGPLNPVTPARVNIYPPQPMAERPYGQSSGSNPAVSVGTLIVMSIITLLLVGLLIWLGRDYYKSGFHKPDVPVKPALGTPQSPQ